MGTSKLAQDQSSYERLFVSPNFIAENADVRTDGRIDLKITPTLARTLSRLIPHTAGSPAPPPPYSAHKQSTFPLSLNIVIQVVGSRGDVQPFIALGAALQKHGHRVRLATHNTFAEWVRKCGLEFYAIGGDPAELMAYMVKNPALVPSMKSLRAGDIQSKRQMVSEMLIGCWKSCISPDELSGRPFVADAIIANPPSFAHVHCAQALGIPVHLMFTMPWTETRSFPHPLANLRAVGVEGGSANFMSYGIVEFMTWQGLGDLINSWRRKHLGLEPVPLSEGPGLLDTLEVPFTYCWSPALIPKPVDWGLHIDVCGFFFRDTPEYTPPIELHTFLRSGTKPIYIGFGSIVIGDPEKLTEIILRAVDTTGVRAIISKGWSKLGAGQTPNPNVLYLDDCPHEWLFQQVSAVIHHGGAGTTACGLLNGKPTAIVPFFGDQQFWGDMVSAANAGPTPIPHKSLNVQNLTDAISFCLAPGATEAAYDISQRMSKEIGVEAAVQSFHKNLPVREMQCDHLSNQPASWSYKISGKKMKLSTLAVTTLAQAGLIDLKELKLYQTKPIIIDVRRWDPVSAIASASLATVTNMADATIDIVRKPIGEYKQQHARNNNSRVSSVASGSVSTLGDQRDTILVSSPSKNVVDCQPLGGLVQLEHNPMESEQKSLHIASAMALASASSLGKVFVSSSKGVLVDIPLAVTEGMRALPLIYDTKHRDYGKVTGLKSGMAVAGKTFGYGVYEGFTDVFVHTFNGKKKEGAKGVAKGLSKGLMSLTMKTGAGVVGLVAYPGQGMCRSIRHALKGETGTEISNAKMEEGKWLIENGSGKKDEIERVVVSFLALRT